MSTARDSIEPGSEDSCLRAIVHTGDSERDSFNRAIREASFEDLALLFVVAIPRAAHDQSGDDTGNRFVLLPELAPNDPLRNRSLAEIGAEYRHKAGKTWRRVLPTYRIARCTFNQLGPAWTENDVWRVECDINR